MSDDPFDLRRRGITDERVLAAMAAVPRAEFVPQPLRGEALADHPLPIGCDQTISQPFVVALMTALLDAGPNQRVLEIGTGSGYQTAVLAQLGARIYSIELEPALATRARHTLDRLGIVNVTTRLGDGYAGWPEDAPFDRILLTAAPVRVPQTLLTQLSDGGRLVAPVGEGNQTLVAIDRDGDRWHRRDGIAVRFVPMRRAAP